MERSNSANDKCNDAFAGDDNVGGFHEEAGYFSESGIVHSKPGPKSDPDNANGSANPFTPAIGKDRGKVIGQPLGTVHIHPKGQTQTSEFIQTPSPAVNGLGGDFNALKVAKNVDWVRPGGYGVVIGARTETVTVYNEGGNMFTMPLSTFLNIGK